MLKDVVGKGSLYILVFLKVILFIFVDVVKVFVCVRILFERLVVMIWFLGRYLVREVEIVLGLVFMLSSLMFGLCWMSLLMCGSMYVVLFFVVCYL